MQNAEETAAETGELFIWCLTDAFTEGFGEFKGYTRHDVEELALVMVQRTLYQ